MSALRLAASLRCVARRRLQGHVVSGAPAALGMLVGSPMGAQWQHPPHVASYAAPLGTAKTAQKGKGAATKSARELLADFDALMKKRAPISEAERARRLRRRAIVDTIRRNRHYGSPMTQGLLLELLDMCDIPEHLTVCFNAIKLFRTFPTSANMDRRGMASLQTSFAKACVKLNLANELPNFLKEGKIIGLLPDGKTFTGVLRIVGDAGDAETFAQLETLAEEEGLELHPCAHLQARLALAAAEHAAGKTKDVTEVVGRVTSELGSAVERLLKGPAPKSVVGAAVAAAETLARLGAVDSVKEIDKFVPSLGDGARRVIQRAVDEALAAAKNGDADVTPATATVASV